MSHAPITRRRGADLRVTNEGDEMPPEHTDRIFERFDRAIGGAAEANAAADSGSRSSGRP